MWRARIFRSAPALFLYILSFEMRFTFLIIAFVYCSSASAQERITLHPIESKTDTLSVEVHVGAAGDSLSQPYSSFQFQTDVSDPSLRFAGISTRWSLSERDGWRVRSNPENGRTGGFASALDAIAVGGVLLTLRFVRTAPESGCQEAEIRLNIFKLNAGHPAHQPDVPSTTVTCRDTSN